MRDIDGISFGDAAIIISIDGRHYRVSNLSSQEIAEVRRAYRAGNFNTSALAIRLSQRFSPHTVPRINDAITMRWVLLRSIDIEWAIRLLSHMMNMAAIIALTAALIILGRLGLISISWPKHVLKPLGHPTIFSSSLIFVTVAITILVHEIGHLTAACKYSGFVGSIGFFISRRARGFYADISSASEVSGLSRAWIYLAGPLMQAIVASALLLTPFASLQTAGMISMLLALVNLLPVATTDGALAIASLSSR